MEVERHTRSLAEIGQAIQTPAFIETLFKMGAEVYNKEQSYFSSTSLSRKGLTFGGMLFLASLGEFDPSILADLQEEIAEFDTFQINHGAAKESLITPNQKKIFEKKDKTVKTLVKYLIKNKRRIAKFLVTRDEEYLIVPESWSRETFDLFILYRTSRLSDVLNGIELEKQKATVVWSIMFWGLTAFVTAAENRKKK